MSNIIKYSIGLQKKTNLLINIKDAKNGLDCKCYCFECGNDLVAINNIENIQKPHFRHKSNANCSASFESYVHFITKEIFKNIQCIELPEIHLNSIIYDKFINELDSIYDSFMIPKEMRYYYPVGYTLQEPTVLKFEKCLIEKEFNTDFGRIRVDVVLIIKNTELLIEPFYTSEIDNEKLKKIINLDKTVLSIDLKSFIKNNSSLFEIKDLTKYIESEISKNWEFIRESKIKSLKEKLFKKLKNSLDKSTINFTKYNKIKTDIDNILITKTNVRNRINEIDTILENNRIYSDYNLTYNEFKNLKSEKSRLRRQINSIDGFIYKKESESISCVAEYQDYLL